MKLIPVRLIVVPFIVLLLFVAMPPSVLQANGAVTPTAIQAYVTPNPEAVTHVLSGVRKEANVAWWGFDPFDSTEFIQQAIDSGAETVIIPYVGADWVVSPIFLRSNLRLILEEGVVVTAKRNEFHGRNDSLFTARDVENLTIIGYGATLRMQKDDYADPLKYEKAEWRMGISIRGSTDVIVEGLTIRDTGGDGIYLGRGTKKYNENVIIRDIVADNNYRQGISVITAKNLLIEDSVFKNTGGTAPMAGIDFEPNHPDERLQNIVVRNSIFEGNEGPGITTYLKNLNSDSEDVSILWENIIVRGSPVGFSFGYGSSDDFPAGEVTLKNCIIEGSERNGIRINNKHDAGALNVTIEDCTLNNVATNPNVNLDSLGGSVPIYLSGDSELSEIYFNNVTIIDSKHRPAFYGQLRTPSDENDNQLGFSNIGGKLQVLNPHGADIRWDGPLNNVDLNVIEIQSSVVPYDRVFSHPHYDLSSVEVIAGPTIHFTEPSSVYPLMVVQRLFTPQFDLRYFNDGDMRRMDVLVDDDTVYSAASAPDVGELVIDTTDLHDGAHLLKVIVYGDDAGHIESTAIFSTQNFQYTVDQMEGPKQVAWFGEVYNPKTIDQSGGWTYETDRSEDFFGDITRKTRRTDTTEYLVWATPSLWEYEMILYVKDITLNDVLKVYGSEDQLDWNVLSYGASTLETSSSGWSKVVVQGSGDVDGPDKNINYVRLVLESSETIGDVQIGRATFKLLREVQ